MSHPFPIRTFWAFVLLHVFLIAGFPPHPSVSAAGLGLTPADEFRVRDGFVVETVYEVPGDAEGSWVALTVDPRGRLIASDQYGGLYRIDLTPSGDGKSPEVRRLDVDINGAQGLLFAFGSLYVNVNSQDMPSGVYRLTDTNGDDQFDRREHLIELNAGGEHGPHALILSANGQRIFLAAGNNTFLPDQIVRSRVTKVWGEDHLLGRMPDARGHNASRLAPGGFVLSFDRDGGDRELVAIGFRNHYDIALNAAGELFTYDADMEWDLGTPWYRPTRINHVISGADFGWRNGTGKWPTGYPDSFGAAVDVGPGSPTGVCFGYETKFPEPYRNALFIGDWSYGNLHAVFLRPDGGSYTGHFETIATAAPLPITDLVARPADGALYFTVGGRKTQSGLYRLRYVGTAEASPPADSPATASSPATIRPEAELRRELEQTHASDSDTAMVGRLLDNLGHTDRAVRHAARVGLEHVDLSRWRYRLASLPTAVGQIHGAVALARVGDPADQPALVDRLLAIDPATLDDARRVDLARAYGLIAMRLKAFDVDQSAAIAGQLKTIFPSGEEAADRQIAELLVHLGDDASIARVVDLMENSPSQESQIHYAITLRDSLQDDGWDNDLRRRYFAWFRSMARARGGMSFGGFLANIRAAAVATLTDQQKLWLSDVLGPIESSSAESAAVQRDFVRAWKTDDLLAEVESLDDEFDLARGKQVFAAARCFQCHRIGLKGGILGPDLTSAGGKFTVTDLIRAMVDPAHEISDQYAATQFVTEDGETLIGRVVNMSEDQMAVMTNMLDPSSLRWIDRDGIELTQPSKTSMMPSGLLDTFTAAEVRDLIAYLRGGGSSDRTGDQAWIEFPGDGPHVVLISGDQEYRSEEAFPQLAKILSDRHGFRCTVLFAIDPVSGEIAPDFVENIPGLEKLDTADLIVLGLRFRNLPDGQMKRIVDYAEGGRPMMALRTSTHPFSIPDDRSYARYSWDNAASGEFEGGFGQRFFGETWLNHHGKHGSESTLGVIADPDHPIAMGVGDARIWGPTDVYGVTLPLRGDGHAVVNGLVLSGMSADDDPVTDGRNDPPMPIAWTRADRGGRVFVTTMGSADDLPSEGVRRMLLAAVHWCLGNEDRIDPNANVNLVGDYRPSKFGFGGFIPGKQPVDYSPR